MKCRDCELWDKEDTKSRKIGAVRIVYALCLWVSKEVLHQKNLTVTTMQMICLDKGCYYEEEE